MIIVKHTHQAIELLKNAMVIRIAMFDEPFPYIVPMCFVYWNNAIYIHSSSKGKKIKKLKENNHVSFELDEYGEIVKRDTVCKWSIKYRSIIGSGDVMFVESENERLSFVKVFSKKYGAHKIDLDFNISKPLEILKIVIKDISFKSNF